MALITANNLSDADASYAALIRAHEGLTEAESHALNARLILILMNQVGDAAIIAEALALARQSGSGHRA
ncbi:MAG: DUF2783 domain-containing protein [Gemmobacter sp.]|uniref:DUF2783 domain-containing protein n=1 Tax=Gemmobacter sp. TaxID=1898957 RepID=UPI00391D10A8